MNDPVTITNAAKPKPGEPAVAVKDSEPENACLLVGKGEIRKC